MPTKASKICALARQNAVEGKQLAEVYRISCHGMSMSGESFDENISLTPPRSLHETSNHRLGFNPKG